MSGTNSFYRLFYKDIDWAARAVVQTTFITNQFSMSSRSLGEHLSQGISNLSSPVEWNLLDEFTDEQE